MIAFLLANWKTILGAVATALLAYLLHALDVGRLEAKERHDLAAQADALTHQCKQEKAITEGVSRDYQTKLGDLGSQLDALRLREPTRCVAVSASGSSGRRDAASGQSKPARANAGITSDALYGFAGDAEKDRLQLIACQSFITQTWAAMGQ